MTDSELDILLDAWRIPEPSPALRQALLARLPAPRKRPARPLRWAALAALAAAGLAVATTVAVRDPTLGATWAQLRPGLHVHTRTHVQPRLAALAAPLSWGGGVTTGRMRQRHFLYDRSARTYTGYEATYSADGPGRYRVSIAPLAATLPELTAGRMPHFQFVPLPAPPAARTVALQEPFEIDIVLAAGGRKRIFDRIVLSDRELPPDPPDAGGPFAHMMLEINNPRLSVNGVSVEIPGVVSSRGATLSFTLPGRGRWTLAIDRDGNNRFVEAGSVESSTLEFSLDGDRFRLQSASPFTTLARRPLYVLFQPDRDLAPAMRATTQAELSSSGPPRLFR